MPERPLLSSRIPRTERVFRETALWRFQDMEAAQMARDLGDLALTLAAESGYWQRAHGPGAVRGRLEAAAADLELLADYLDEVAEAAMEPVEGPEPDELESAREHATRLRELVASLRGALAERPVDRGPEGSGTAGEGPGG